MKFVFSRKGFDSATGGRPSPLIGGVPRSLPIPSRSPSPTRYRDLRGGVGARVEALTLGRIRADSHCHLDPDIDRVLLTRKRGWRGAFGQAGAAQGHLANQGVGIGDVFLFWGLFRAVLAQPQSGVLRYVDAPEHRIFGWLQVGEIFDPGAQPQPALAPYAWLDAHPHCSGVWPANNRVYIGRRRLCLDGTPSSIPGFGVLRSGVRLSHTDREQPSLWRAPAWLNPLRGGPGLSYHASARWAADDSLQTVARGQEFVADVGADVEPRRWLLALLSSR